MKKLMLVVCVVLFGFSSMYAQEAQLVKSASSLLVEEAGSFYFYGNQVMNKREYMDFLSTRCTPAYQKFQSGYKLYQAGWGLFGAGLGVDLIGSLLVALAPNANKDGSSNDAMFYSGIACLGLGAASLVASIPTAFIGYARMDESVDIYNVSQRTAAASRPYWSVQAGNNAVGIAYNF